MRLAGRESKQLQGNTDTSSGEVQPVNAFHKKPFSSQEQTDLKFKTGGKQCSSCGSSQHMAAKYNHIESTSSYCKKPGHLAKLCFKKKKKRGNNTTHQVAATPTPGTTPREAEEDTNCPFTVYLKSVESARNSSIIAPLYKRTATIQDKEVPMKVDTGSSVTLLSSTDFSKIGGHRIHSNLLR